MHYTNFLSLFSHLVKRHCCNKSEQILLICGYFFFLLMKAFTVETLTVFSNTLNPLPRAQNGGSVEPLFLANFSKIFLGAAPPDPRDVFKFFIIMILIFSKNSYKFWSKIIKNLNFFLIFTKIYSAIPIHLIKWKFSRGGLRSPDIPRTFKKVSRTPTSARGN